MNYRASYPVKAVFYLLVTLFHANSDSWSQRTLPLPRLGAVIQNPVWIHPLRPTNPLVGLAKPCNPATDCQQQMPLFHPAEQVSS